MTEPTSSTTPADSAAGAAATRDGRFDEIARTWSSGWQRYVFPSVWMAYLVETGFGVHAHSSGALAVLGYAVLAAFGLCYINALPISWTERHPAFWKLYGAAVALTVVECFLAQDSAFVFLVYLAVLTVGSRARWSWPAIVGYVLVGTFVPPLVPSWHQGIDWGTGVTVLLVPFAMWGFFHIIESNGQLSAARAEVARLAAENERSRIARDLHDLLGHSLTTITVKAGLARRLGERGETERALAEIAEVEQLSRRTLGDVRAAVSAHREVSLVNELATAREVLRASAISAEMPPSVADTDPELSELFGWILREGITNVVRHAHAQHVRVDLERRAIEISDDGVGGGGCGPGNGLRGLRERAEDAGGTLAVETSARGFRLRVEVPQTAPANGEDAADSGDDARPERVAKVPTS